jgi:hypothetical protein
VPFIDLPFHNAAPDAGTTVTSPEALAVAGDSQYGVVTSYGEFIAIHGTVTTAALPEGAVYQGAHWAVSAYRMGGYDRGDYDPGDLRSSQTVPCLVMGTTHNTPAIEPIPFSSYGEVTEPIEFFTSLAFTPPDLGGPPLGSTVGLFIYAGPTDISPGEYDVHIEYAAVRLIYLMPGQPPRRVYPRDDALTGGAQRVFPPNKTQQHGNRVTGGYL